ncbi:RNA 2',3'-cyclic phosphodiesterase [Bacillus cytotoxicus]|uniref:RNA 2',3'-cyclic phosphodiesterase n=1 Tax=Bacillus cytotoxicus TaxID=580165 RepID=UPI0006607577|nr:RNA 2',3'-cyclic phosphodiesterase [Bacillus cytotoxicus]AWC34224.1 RNA 2',3'-cyclic phosphodiesterase [Bacillus cytotoxicus]AWC38224.1 RNA 2',3'-cyclic phosphodiesterase [Bacillus cytotoxicus]AWC46197.1 RNA 2',3'-cyclic phosphodiesterase [Bacillus cytotoxicus]AWC62438.1 RNA 2',3'-cyclic phosphodiesterase [Bacillus cytotoxicus]KMT48733.1 2'-5' RNA ligase [Bacillus cytotoxicus]
MVPHYFIAITLPHDIKERLANYKEEMNDTLPFRSWVHKEDYHITLAFLGSATQEQLQEIKEGLHLLKNEQEFSLLLQGFSTFGPPERPRIFWTGLEESKALLHLQKKVHSICERSGFSLETRPFHPHITIARKWIGEAMFHIEDIKELKPVSFPVDTVTLYRSNMKDTPKYHPVTEIKLQKCNA